MGKPVLYLPLFYHNQIQSKDNYPFWVNKEGLVRYFIPGSVQSTVFTQVSPFDDHSIHRMEGGVFEGANREDFSDAQVLHTVKRINGPCYHTANTNNHKAFRYFRFVSARGGSCDIAEIEFYSSSGEKLQGTVIGTMETRFNDPSVSREKAFDGDPTTSFIAANDQSWTGLDMGQPATVSQIRYFPRVEGWGVYEGQVYELFYWNGNQWLSAGKKKADSHYLIYDVPSHVICFLKNITKDRSFFARCYTEDGVQKWLVN